MRRSLLLLVLCLSTLLLPLPVMGQSHQKFDPEKYKADLEQYITTQACLTPTEASAFFPVYEEMQVKLRAIFKELEQNRKYKPASEEACRQSILKCDKLEIEMKQIRSEYNVRFLRIISAEKLFDVLKAEGHFHRQQFKNMSKCPRKH